SRSGAWAASEDPDETLTAESLRLADRAGALRLQHADASRGVGRQGRARRPAGEHRSRDRAARAARSGARAREARARREGAARRRLREGAPPRRRGAGRCTGGRREGRHAGEPRHRAGAPAKHPVAPQRDGAQPRRSDPMRSPSLLLWIPAAAFVAACASGTNPAFLDANAAYRAAAGDPKVTANAPVELHDAQQALDRAAQAHDDRKSDAEIEHLSYLARRRVEIAEARADQKVAEQSSEALADQKDAVLLDARKREVDALTRELAELKARETDRGIE